MQGAPWSLLLVDGLFDWLQGIWLWLMAILAVLLALCIFCVCGVLCVCAACSKYFKGRSTAASVYKTANATLNAGQIPNSSAQAGQALVDSSAQAVSDKQAQRRRNLAKLAV